MRMQRCVYLSMVSLHPRCRAFTRDGRNSCGPRLRHPNARLRAPVARGRGEAERSSGDAWSHRRRPAAALEAPLAFTQGKRRVACPESSGARAQALEPLRHEPKGPFQRLQPLSQLRQTWRSWHRSSGWEGGAGGGGGGTIPQTLSTVHIFFLQSHAVKAGQELAKVVHRVPPITGLCLPLHDPAALSHKRVMRNENTLNCHTTPKKMVHVTHHIRS